MRAEDLEPLLEHIRAIDPDLVLAADEVDGALLDWFAGLTPRERLDRAIRMGADLEELHRGRHAR